MKAFGNPIGNPVRGADGGQGTKVGDIVFAAKAPSANFIPITNQRVYADAYPRLADVLQVRRENDGAEWIRPGGLFPASDPSGGAYLQPCCGGLSGGSNVLVMGSQDQGKPPLVLRGDPNGKVFNEVAAIADFTSWQKVVGAVSDKGTIILLAIRNDGNGYLYGALLRSTDALRSRTVIDAQVAGLGDAGRLGGEGPFVLSMGGDVWIIVNYYGDVFRSDNDGRDWRLVTSVTWTGQNSGSSYTTPTAYIRAACAANGRIWLANANFTQNGGNSTQEDAVAYSDDLFASYGRLRLLASGMADAYNVGLGTLAGDLVILQWQRTLNERNGNIRNLPLRGLYVPDANPANAAVTFAMDGTAGAGDGTGSRHTVFSWDGLGYMGIAGYGLFRVQPRSMIRTRVSPVGANAPVEQQWNRDSFVQFPNFALAISGEQLRLPERSLSVLQAVPSALARRYYQFSDASVVGSQRSDGKLPFMRAR